MSTPDSIRDFTDGDEAAARQLRASLSAVRDRLAGQPESEELRRHLDAVLTGRMSMRDLADVPAFRTLAEGGMREVQAEWERLSPEQRAAAMRAGADLAADARQDGTR